MGLYTNNKIYGIKWFRLVNQKIVNTYEFKSMLPLVEEDIMNIKTNYVSIDPLEKDNYIFLIYKSFTSTLDFPPVNFYDWEKTNSEFVDNLLG